MATETCHIPGEVVSSPLVSEATKTRCFSDPNNKKHCDKKEEKKQPKKSGKLHLKDDDDALDAAADVRQSQNNSGPSAGDQTWFNLLFFSGTRTYLLLLKTELLNNHSSAENQNQSGLYQLSSDTCPPCWVVAAVMERERERDGWRQGDTRVKHNTVESGTPYWGT